MAHGQAASVGIDRALALAALVVAGGLVELLRIRHDHRRHRVQESGLAPAGRPEDGHTRAPGPHHLQAGVAAPVEDLDLLDAELPGRDGVRHRSSLPSSSASASSARELPLTMPSGDGEDAGPAAWRKAASKRRISSTPTRGTTTGEMV